MAFPTSPSNGDEYTNALGTVYKYNITDDKWYIINATLQHNNMGGLNAGDDYEHITQTQKDALHAIYSLEVHDNDKHDPDYETANANIQSHVATPDEDIHHPKNHNNTEHTTNYEVANANIQSHVASPASDAHHTPTVAGDLNLNDLAEKDHASLANKNAETDFKHLTDAQQSALGDAIKIQGKTVDDADIANGKILKYNSSSGNLEYEIDDTGAGFAPPIGFIAMFSGSWTDNSTIPGWYKCDGNNGTVNLVNQFIRGGTTSGATGGSDDAVVVSHDHITYHISGGPAGSYLEAAYGTRAADRNYIEHEGVSGTDKNIPAYYTLIFIQRIS